MLITPLLSKLLLHRSMHKRHLLFYTFTQTFKNRNKNSSALKKTIQNSGIQTFTTHTHPFPSLTKIKVKLFAIHGSISFFLLRCSKTINFSCLLFAFITVFLYGEVLHQMCVDRATQSNVSTNENSHSREVFPCSGTYREFFFPVNKQCSYILSIGEVK